jgi:hypothetical protein
VNGFANLLMLCQEHHTIVDRNPDEYRIEALEAMKAAHEARARPLARDELLAALDSLLRIEAMLDAAIEAERPTFERIDGAVTRLVADFQPQWRIKQASGQYVACKRSPT